MAGAALFSPSLPAVTGFDPFFISNWLDQAWAAKGELKSTLASVWETPVASTAPPSPPAVSRTAGVLGGVDSRMPIARISGAREGALGTRSNAMHAPPSVMLSGVCALPLGTPPLLTPLPRLPRRPRGDARLRRLVRCGVCAPPPPAPVQPCGARGGQGDPPRPVGDHHHLYFGTCRPRRDRRRGRGPPRRSEG